MTCEIRLGHVLGLPAILGERCVGYVEHASLEEDGRRLRGLMIRRGLGAARWAGRDSVKVVGNVSVILQHAPERTPRKAAFALGSVKDENGLTLGRVTDVWISPETLVVTALEVTLGPLEDLRRGRLRVREWAIQPGTDGDAMVFIGRREWEV